MRGEGARPYFSLTDILPSKLITSLASRLSSPFSFVTYGAGGEGEEDMGTTLATSLVSRPYSIWKKAWVPVGG